MRRLRYSPDKNSGGLLVARDSTFIAAVICSHSDAELPQAALDDGDLLVPKVPVGAASSVSPRRLWPPRTVRDML